MDRVGGGKQRIEIEHIQSDDRMRTGSMAAALAWIETREYSPAADLLHCASTDGGQPGDAERAPFENS
jgi:hypothetical protein